MRTLHWNAPIIGAGALLFLVMLPAPTPLTAEEAKPRLTAKAPELKRPGLAQLKAKLDESDRVVAVRALEMALSEIADGVTLIWKRPERNLVGRIKPVFAYRDDKGRVCRRLTYSLALDGHEKSAEGVACREPDGRWTRAG
jgi:surface antigen